MKKSNLYMFLILQLLLVITNVFNLNNNALIFELTDILKVVIIMFAILYITLLSNLKSSHKIIYLTALLILGGALILDNNSYSKIINVYYYISTYSYLIFFYKNNNLKRHYIINTFTLLLFGLCLYSIIFNSSNIEIELLINLLLSISLTYYHSDLSIRVPIILLVLLTSFLTGMYLILINAFIVSLIILFKSKTIEERLSTIICFIIILIIAINKNILNTSELLNIFSRIDINLNYITIAIMIPLLMLLSVLISKYIQSKEKTLGLTLNMYSLIVYVTFGTLALTNISEGVSLIILSYIFIITSKRLDSLNSRIKDNVSIITLHLGYGGIEQYVSSLTRMIDKKIKIISTYKLYEKEPFEYNASKEYLINYGPNKDRLYDALNNGKNIIHVIKEALKSIGILYKRKYELIEKIEEIDSKYIITTRDFHNELVGLYSRKNIIKIATEHNHHNNDKKYVKKIIKSVRNSNYLILVSKQLEEFYREKVVCATMYIPNVLDKLPDKFSDSNDHSIVTIGRLNKVKAFDDLIKVVSLIKEDYKDVSLTIIGDGEERDNLIKLINKKKLSKNVRITGFLNKYGIELELINKNVFAMTSLSESFGLVALEASSYKLPVVAFDSAEGLKEILKDGNGVLVEKRNLEKMKEEIEKLFEDRKYRNKIANAGYKNVQKYLSNNVKKMWMELIH